MSKTSTPTSGTKSPKPATAKPVLAVDLDGTLLRSDMLYESFWNLAAKDFPKAMRAALSLGRGKAALKRAIAQDAQVDVTLLPYNAEVLEFIKTWKSDGGTVALVTASDQVLADEIAAHLGVFDEVHGSDGARNLKGPNKAAFLCERYGKGGFAYAGDHAADVDVWAEAAHAVTVNADDALRGKAEAVASDVTHLGHPPSTVKAAVKALRPHQWMKNILVFIPMLLAHNITFGTVLTGLLAFVVFSLVASSVYVLNDLLDLDADRNHARKCKRPFAAGDLPLSWGTGMATGLLAAGALLALLLGPVFFFVMACYYAATTAYSFYFKRRAVVDVAALAGLYTLRVIAGGVAIGVPLSPWLLAFSMFFFFALAAVKRQAELVDNLAAGKVKPTGRGYRNEDVAIMSQMAIGSGYVSILLLALYMNSPAVIELYSNPQILWGICVVLLYWISRIVLLAHRGEMHDDPIIFAVRDHISRVCGLMVVGFALGASLT
ncbi:UbiA family prenyltransferase [Celeribacter sp.]|uniref:UbiA family prenyltransferase n=1 Tax=Celeribacter sp. TaxID=1890673 RepID=UPI003A8F0FA6